MYSLRKMHTKQTHDQFPIKPQLARLYRSSAKLTRSVFRIGDIENLQFDKRAGAAADETF